MREVCDCPACGSASAAVVARIDERLRERFVEFSELKYGGLLARWLDEVPPLVVQCDACGHCWYRYQPDDAQLSEMYAAGRPLTEGPPPSLEPTTGMCREMRRLRRILGRPWLQRPTLLDYGSGSGRWSIAASSSGFVVTAYEPSEQRSGGTRAGIELVHRTSALNGRRFDAIQLEQVLEHVPDPLGSLLAIRELCHSHTVLRIAVPNLLRADEGPQLWSEWPFNGRSPHFLAPFEHLHGFTPRSLDLLLARAGFKSARPGAEWLWNPRNRVRSMVALMLPGLGSTLRYVGIT